MLSEAPMHRHPASVPSHLLGLVPQIPCTFAFRSKVFPITIQLSHIQSTYDYPKGLVYLFIVCLVSTK